MGSANDIPKGRVGTVGMPGPLRKYTDSPGDGMAGVATRLMDVHGLAVRVRERDGRMEGHLEKESYQLIQLSIKPILTFGCGLVGWLVSG